MKQVTVAGMRVHEFIPVKEVCLAGGLPRGRLVAPAREMYNSRWLGHHHQREHTLSLFALFSWMELFVRNTKNLRHELLYISRLTRQGPRCGRARRDTPPRPYTVPAPARRWLIRSYHRRRRRSPSRSTLGIADEVGNSSFPEHNQTHSDVAGSRNHGWVALPQDALVAITDAKTAG